MLMQGKPPDIFVVNSFGSGFQVSFYLSYFLIHVNHFLFVMLTKYDICIYLTLNLLVKCFYCNALCTFFFPWNLISSKVQTNPSEASSILSFTAGSFCFPSSSISFEHKRNSFCWTPCIPEKWCRMLFKCWQPYERQVFSKEMFQLLIFGYSCSGKRYITC